MGGIVDLAGQTVIITGASRGIGADTAREFITSGANVALLARSKNAIDGLAAELGDNAIAIECDVAEFDQLKTAVDTTVDRFGGVDVFIGNAGVIDPISRMADADPNEWGKVIDINLKGVFYGMRAVLPVMKANGGGTIITISSGAATNAIEGWSHYCSSKAGALMMTQMLHKEEAENGIRALGLSPGTVATQMQREIAASGINPVSQIPWDVHIPADWPAKALVWMCGADADPFLGGDISLRDENIRHAVGLV